MSIAAETAVSFQMMSRSGRTLQQRRLLTTASCAFTASALPACASSTMLSKTSLTRLSKLKTVLLIVWPTARSLTAQLKASGPEASRGSWLLGSLLHQMVSVPSWFGSSTAKLSRALWHRSEDCEIAEISFSAVEERVHCVQVVCPRGDSGRDVARLWLSNSCKMITFADSV